MLPNNSRAKLIRLEIKIRFIFRERCLPLASVSVEAFSVWPDKHLSTLSPDLLSPSESHLIDKRPRRVQLLSSRTAEAGPAPPPGRACVAQGGLCVPLPPCLLTLRQVPLSPEPEKPSRSQGFRTCSHSGSARS